MCQDKAEERGVAVATSIDDNAVLAKRADAYYLKISAMMYKKYPAAEARRIIKRLEIHYTPRHGSWLDIAEIELNVMTRQCLSRRINGIGELHTEPDAWEIERNSIAAKVNWQFRTPDARIKLQSLYPTFPDVAE